jgi:hypothetical protein
MAMLAAALLTACCPVWFLHDDDTAALAHRGEVPAGPIVFRCTTEGPVESVHLTGDFLGWEPAGLAMEDPDGDGTYEVTHTLPAGEYQYKFVINGEHWVADPDNQERIDDGMGGDNSLLFVVAE